MADIYSLLAAANNCVCGDLEAIRRVVAAARRYREAERREASAMDACIAREKPGFGGLAADDLECERYTAGRAYANAEREWELAGAELDAALAALDGETKHE